jgi:Flp pilus assembly protein TadG
MVRGNARRRARASGAAVIEFALMLPFLVPLLLGMIEYGRYFWISVNAVEAAKVGLAATIAQNNAAPAANCSAATVNHTSTGVLGAGEIAAVAYFTTNVPQLASYATATVTCIGSGPVNGATLTYPSWKIVVKMDFPPLIGYRLPWMKASSTLSGGITYSTPALIRTL